MQAWQRVAVNGAIFGAVVGIAYHLYTHVSGGNWAPAMTMELLYSALIGALAGALAFVVRRSAS